MSAREEEPSGLEIAVVGIGGRFPGARDVDELWQLLVEGREAISFFDPGQLAAAGVPPEDSGHRDYVPAYGVLSDVERFDAEFFGYTPRDASILDPQQRLFLECAWEALEASGHLAADAEELVGVYAGASMSSYLLHNLVGNPNLAEASEYELLLANDKDSLATRVAYHLDLRGHDAAHPTPRASGAMSEPVATDANSSAAATPAPIATRRICIIASCPAARAVRGGVMPPQPSAFRGIRGGLAYLPVRGGE